VHGLLAGLLLAMNQIHLLNTLLLPHVPARRLTPTPLPAPLLSIAMVMADAMVMAMSMVSMVMTMSMSMTNAMVVVMMMMTVARLLFSLCLRLGFRGFGALFWDVSSLMSAVPACSVAVGLSDGFLYVTMSDDGVRE